MFSLFFITYNVYILDGFGYMLNFALFMTTIVVQQLIAVSLIIVPLNVDNPNVI